MTTTGRSAESRRVRRGPAQWLLGLLLALAICASIAMMFSDSRSIAASLAVIAALWSAVIGAILVTKFRRQADSAESKARDLRLVYELQLEREITARRQYELGVETQIRREVHAETNEELGSLKAQIESLRASLELLVGGDLPEQRTALWSQRRRELDRARSHSDDASYADGDVFPATYDDGVAAERDFASTAPDASADAVPMAAPNTMTEVIPVITDDGQTHAHSGAHESIRPNDVVARHEAGAVATSDEVEVEVEAFIDETPTDEWAVAPADVAPEPLEPTDVVKTPRPPVTPTPYGGGRHGRPAAPAVDPSPSSGAHEAGRSASDLIEQLRAGAGGGRRRRRDDRPVE